MTSNQQWLNGAAEYSTEALENLPPAVRIVFGNGSIPVRFFYYFSSDSLVEDVPGVADRRLIRFGFSLSRDYILVDLDTLEVLQVRPRDLKVVSLVNSSLDSFISFLALSEDRYPYYDDNGEGDFDLFMAVSNELKSKMAQIDARALAPGSYWSDFLSDVGNGDYGETVDDEDDDSSD